MNILGVSCYYHDAAAALVQDGRLTAAAQEERFSRRKHDPRFPRAAIEFCTKHGGVPPQELDYIVFYEKPLLKFERFLSTSLAFYPRTWELFREGTIAWFQQRLWIRDQLRQALRVPPERILFVDHHLAHAASAFFCSPFREAAILTVDGVGEWATATRGSGTADWDGTGVNRIRLTQEMRFPHSLGLLYSVFTAFLGFEVNEGEYKVMGMAPYGEPRYLEELQRMARLADDGSLLLDLDYFRFAESVDQNYSRKFLEVFGPPRPRDAEFFVDENEPGAQGRTAELARNRHYADVAATIQRFTEEALVRMARSLQRETGLKQLCMAGGVALNSVANARILRDSGFEELFIQPAAGDSGGAVGAALYAYHAILGRRRCFVLEDAYLGEQYGSAEVQQALRAQGAPFESFDDEEKLVEQVVDAIVAGKVVGYLDGRFEWGPRALGNRSILADPRSVAMKQIVNSKIKFREPFRPFAPVVPEDRVAEMFQGSPDWARQYPSRFMLLVLPWKPAWGERVPAVNHVGTGRLQSLRREWNPRYFRLVERFGQATGVPVLMNTSFNLRGEPIVATPEDALKTFYTSGIDVLVMGNHLLRK